MVLGRLDWPPNVARFADYFGGLEIARLSAEIGAASLYLGPSSELEEILKGTKIGKNGVNMIVAALMGSKFPSIVARRVKGSFFLYKYCFFRQKLPIFKLNYQIPCQFSN